MNMQKKFNIIFLLLALGSITACWRKKTQPVVPVSTIHVPSSYSYLDSDNSIIEDLSGFELQEESNPFENISQNSQNISLVSDESLKSENENNAFKNIYFDYDQYKVKEDQQAMLTYNLEKAKEMTAKNYTLIIEGHACDSAGTSQYNMILSEDRAKNVARYFINNGVKESNIQVVGFGCQMRLVENGDKNQQAPNRRVEIKVDLK